MRIFVTGATGFLGNRVISELSGHELLCLSRTPQALPRVSHLLPLSGDLAKPNEWRVELQRFAPQWCLHLAWEGLPDYSLSRCRSNLDAGIGLIETLADAGIERIVAAGSCWEYGNTSGAAREDQPVGPCGVFAAAKRSLQMMLESLARDRGFEYRWGRIFFAYGPGQRATSLIAHCHAAFAQDRRPKIRSPQQAEDFIYIDDVAWGLAAITQADVGSGIFNIGSGRPTTVASVVNRVAKHFGAPPLFPLQEPESGFWADTAKITAATGWKAQTSIDDGITQTLKVLDDKR